MNTIFCLIAGYLIGCINPAYIISKFKKVDLRKNGTGNIGTTNAFLNFGKKWGIFVMTFDILKAFLTVRNCFCLFPNEPFYGLIAGAGAVLGHIYPFYTKFKGGKGIAAFGGLVLALDIRCFLFLTITGFLIALIVNWGCGLSFFSAGMFPFLYGFKTRSILIFAVLSCISFCIIMKHQDNVKKIRKGEELPLRKFLINYILKRRKNSYE